MELPRGEQSLTVDDASRGGLVVIGNFDGVHRGHQALVADAATQAEARALVPVLLTFDPHPAKVLGRAPPPTLTALPRKLELVARVAPAMKIAVVRFDRAFAAQTPEQFAKHVLVDRLGARVVIVGENFCFGKDRKGDFTTLVHLGQTLGFETRSHTLIGDDGGPWSSSRARAAVARGDLDAIRCMLGRPHMLSGTVVEGDRRGRTLGFPTCNLSDVDEALPPFGVYAVLVDRVVEPQEGARVLARGVANIGVRPTVKGADPRATVEAHLFDHDESLYGVRLRVHLVDKLRPEQRFAGLDALKAQIAHDVERARAVLSNVSPDPSARGAWF